MGTYAWPANLTKNEKGWITTFVDWPDIAAIKASAQDSMLEASEQLNNEIEHRLEQKAHIPAPSEVKPGQIQIPASSRVNHLLDALIQKENEKQLQNLAQIEHANREKRSSYLTEYRMNLDSVERLRDQADEAAIKFATIGINFNYFLNGGALVALPAILQFAEKGSVNLESLNFAMWLFVAGIVLAGLTNFLAYRSVIKAAEAHSEEINARAMDVSLAYYPPEDPSERQTEAASKHTTSKLLLGVARTTANWGILTFAVSNIFFLVGLSLIIWSVSNH